MFLALVTLLTGLAWPIVIGSALFHFRREIKAVLHVGSAKLSHVSKLKVGSVEIESAIDSVVQQVRIDVQASADLGLKNVDIEPAFELRQKLEVLGARPDEQLQHVKLKILQLAASYDDISLEQSVSTPSRTLRLMRLFRQCEHLLYQPIRCSKPYSSRPAPGRGWQPLQFFK